MSFYTMEVQEKEEQVRRVKSIVFETDGQEEDKRLDDEGWSCAWRQELPVSVLTAFMLLLLVEFAVGVEGVGRRGKSSTMLDEESPRPLDLWESVFLSTLVGSGYGLAVGTGAVVVIWIAEALSASSGLVAVVWQVPLLGLLTGAGAGALNGLDMLSECVGQETLCEAARGGLKGIWVGVKVAVVGGATIGAAMCVVSAVAMRNLVRGGHLRLVPLVTVSAAAGAFTVVLSWAPETMTIGCFLGALLGSTQDPAVLKTLGLLAVGGCAGVKGLRSPCVSPSVGSWWPQMLNRALVGAGGAVFLAAVLGFPLRPFPVLVRISVGAVMAFSLWWMVDGLCHSAATVMFGVLSISAQYEHGESGG
ncbi:uncharacterized protein LOC125718024 [Brienomyrus brachyistius]|uniref:uncharacterized protein LOC125718024 n=1 Tax=Brienomyrus brachyistius TaxID=42636 RepID=UPI0020B3A971|nr:uncharacterized protein LOC125718024 [Brienomyrus brachyistius]